MYGRAALALLLLGCGTLPAAARPLSPVTAERALSVWVAAGYPVGRCRERLRELRTLVVADSEVDGVCRRQGVSGCVRGDVIVMRQADAGPRLLAHELVHWLGRCSSTPTPHGDRRLFHMLDSVQVRLSRL